MSLVTPLLVLQLSFAASALALITLRVRELLFVAATDATLFAGALRNVLAGQERASVRELADAFAPAWVGVLVTEALERAHQDGSLLDAVNETLQDLEAHATRHVFAIYTAGRIALPLALGCAIIELGAALQGDGAGAQALARGAAESSAIDRGMLAITLGLATAFTCQAAVALLQREARSLAQALQRTAEQLRAAAWLQGE